MKKTLLVLFLLVSFVMPAIAQAPMPKWPAGGDLGGNFPAPTVVNAGDAIGVLHPVANLSDVGSVPTSLQNLRGNPGSPFVYVCSGQSNAQGADDTGDKTIQAGIKIWNGTAMVTAAFGTAPLNVGLSGTTSNPALAFNNACVWAANHIRLSGMIPAAREIWIIPNWFPGESIGRWIDSGIASPNFDALITSLNLSGVDHIDVFSWKQGEANSLSTPPYNSQSAYAAAFSTLYAQLTALAQWKPWTVSLIQQLNLFSGSGYTSNARNDFFNTLGVAPLSQNMALIRTAGIPQSCEYGGCPSTTPHYSGAGLITLGFRDFLGWAAQTLGMGTPQAVNVSADGYPQGNGQYLPCINGVLTYHDGTTQSATPIPLGINDLRMGAMIGSANCSWQLPVQGLTYGMDYNVSILDVWSVSGGATVLNNAQGVTVYFNDGTSSSGTAVSISAVGKFLLYSDRSRWVATQINPALPTNLYIAGKGAFGTTSPFSIAGTRPQLETTVNMGIGRATADATGPRLWMYKTRGDFVTRSAVTSNDVVGDFLMYGDDGTADQLVARFRCYVSGTVSSGIVPGACTFSTTTTGGVSTDAFTISNTQRVSFVKGLSSSGADIFLNTNSNFQTFVGTGTTTENVTLGGGFNSVIIGSQWTAPISTKSANYTITTTDYTIRCDATAGAVTITLPASPIAGLLINVKKIDASVNACVVNGGTKPIDGSFTQSIAIRYNVLRLQYDSTSGTWNLL